MPMAGIHKRVLRLSKCLSIRHPLLATVFPRYEPDERGWQRAHSGLRTWFRAASGASVDFQEMVGIVTGLSTGKKTGS